MMQQQHPFPETMSEFYTDSQCQRKLRTHVYCTGMAAEMSETIIFKLCQIKPIFPGLSL